MATTPSAISAPSSSVFDQIGSALSEPVSSEPSQAETTTQAEPEAQTTETPAPDQDATSDVTADATASTDQQQQEEPNPYDQPEGEVPKQTLDVILQTPRGREIYQGYKALKELSKPFEQGGLGFVPTVEQAREHLVSHRGRMMMEADLNSGNPQQVEKVIAHLLDPTRGEGTQVFASRIGPALIKMAQEASARNPQLASAYTQAYTAAAQPFLSTYGTALWDRWQEMPDGQPGSDQARAKAALGYAAQVLENDLTGKYRDVSGNAQEQPAQDPYADRRADVEAREANLRAYQQNQQQAEVQRVTQHVNGQIDTTLRTELDKALAPLKKLYETSPKKYTRALNEFNEMVMREVPKNQYAWEIFQTQYREAVRTRNPQLIESLSKEYVRLATPIITARRKAFLEEEGAVVQKASDAQHASLRSTASHGTPTSNGGGSRNPVPNTPLTRKPGEQQANFMRRLLQNA